MTLDELNAQMQSKLNAIAAIESDPESLMPSGSLWKYTPRARKKLDSLRLDVTHLLGKKREIQGNPVDQAGYSGRQTNRR